MAAIYEKHGAFHLRLYSNVDISTGIPLEPNEQGKVLRKQQTLLLCRKDEGLFRTETSPAVRRLAADKQEQIERWEEAVSNGEPIVHDPTMTVSDFFHREFVPSLQRQIAAGSKSHSTLTSYLRYWKTFLANHFNGAKTLRGYTPSIGARFLQTLTRGDGTPYGENTINHIHSAASGIFSLAVELEYINHNPWHDVKKGNISSVGAEEGIAFTEAQVEALIDNLALNTNEKERRSVENAQMALALGMWAGLRPSEIAALKFEDINVDKGTILVRRGHVYGKTKESTKTGRDRVVYYLNPSPLVNRLRFWISERRGLHLNGWLLENRDGNPISLNGLSVRIITPVAEKMGFSDWQGAAWYGCRRGFGTLLVLSGASCEEVAKQMGNTRDVVWKFYFKDRDNELAQSAAAKYAARKLNQAVLAGSARSAAGTVRQLGEGI